MTRQDASSRVASAARGARSRAIVFAGLVAAAVFVAMAVLTGIAFAAWVRVDNAIRWPAEEYSTTPRLPAGHELFGWALGISLFVFGSVVCAALLVAVLHWRIRWTAGRVGWGALFAVTAG